MLLEEGTAEVGAGSRTALRAKLESVARTPSWWIFVGSRWGNDVSGPFLCRVEGWGRQARKEAGSPGRRRLQCPGTFS